MRHIGKILKKYIPAIIIIVILLFGQAQIELKLPEYTSNIINVGIQSKGIESTVFDIVSEDTLDSIVSISGDHDIYKSYNLKKHKYYIKDISKEEKEELKNKLLKPTVFYSFLKNMDAFKDASPEVILFAMTNEVDHTLRNYYKELDKYDETMLSQIAIGYLQVEYKNLGIDLDKKQMDYIFKIGITMIILTFVCSAVIVLTAFISSRVASSFGYDLREEMVRKITYFAHEDVNKFNTSSLITRCTNDISQVQMTLTLFLRMVLFAPIIGIGAVIKLLGNKAGMSWVIACAIGVIIVMLMILLFVAMPKFKAIQKIMDRINQIVREQLNGLPVIRAFANEEMETDKFNAANEELVKVNLFTNKVMALIGPVMTIVMNGTMVLIYFVALKKIDSGALQVGTLTAFLTYTMHIIMSFMMISMLSIMGPRAMISVNRISEVLDTNTKLKEKKNPKTFDGKKQGLVEFKDVSFKFRDGSDYVLNNVTFTARKGTTTAIIGATGSGKSALVNLIPRYFDVTKGSVSIDGIDVRDVAFKDLRDKVSYVPQKGYLFSGTIESNIKFNNENLSDEEMVRAANIACASEFIDEKEEKYQFEISQGGTNVSGGQKQRLCIARAVAKNAEILILDDSLSALDYKTDSVVRKHLQEELKDITKIIVAQRVATVMNADQIIVLDKGKVVGKGTHKELYKNCKVYKEIALSQLKEEELV